MINSSQLVTNLLSILVFFALFFGFTKFLGPIPFDVTSVTTNKSDVFSVNGEGKIQATPDSAKVSLGVLAKAESSEEAKTLLNTNINKVIGSIKSLGIEDKDIKTENFNIYPEYGEIRPVTSDSPFAGKNDIYGYIANTNIYITTSTPELANQVIDIGVRNGANQVGGVDFQVEDKTIALNQARELAVADAKKKAEDAARIAGFKLGKVINYSESEGGDYPRPMMGVAMDKAESAPTNVQPGTNEIIVTVTLSYEVR